jgi:hypothetical protein
MEGIKKFKKFRNFLKTKKKFFLICFGSIVVIGICFIFILSYHTKTKVSAFTNDGTNCIVDGENVMGVDPSWCKNEKLTLKNGAHVFMNGSHIFNSITLDIGTELGTVDLDNNIAYSEDGYITIDQNTTSISYFFANQTSTWARVWLKKNGTSDAWQSYDSKFGFNHSYASSGQNIDISKYNNNSLSGTYQIELQVITNGSWGANGSYIVSGASQTSFHLSSDSKTPASCGTDTPTIGLCANYYIWGNSSNNYYPFNSHPTDNSLAPAVGNINSLRTTIIAHAEAPSNSNLEFHQADPFIRTQDFASLNLDISSGDLNNNGTIEIAGGKNGGPYVAQNYYAKQTLPDYSNDWLSNGKIKIQANNINSKGLIVANGSPGSYYSLGIFLDSNPISSELYDGGNGGIIILNASKNISLNDVEANGGKGYSIDVSPGGGGSGGIIQISGDTSGVISGIHTDGGQGGQALIASGNGVQDGGRPGHSLFSYIETQFINNPNSPNSCWLDGIACPPWLYTPTNKGNNCAEYQQQDGSSQQGGCGGGSFNTMVSVPQGTLPNLITKYYGIFGGSGGAGNSNPYPRKSGGAGGGAGGIIILKFNTISKTIDNNSGVDAAGGQGGENSFGNGGGLGGISKMLIPGINLLDDINKIKDNFQSFVQNNPSLGPQPGNVGLNGGAGGSGSNGGGGGGGGAGGIVNILNTYSPPVQPNQIQGDVHANGKITISGNATGIVTASGAININMKSILGDIGKKSGYTINSSTLNNDPDTDWTEATSDATASLNRIETERAQPYSGLVTAGYNLSGLPGGVFDKNPEGGVWWKKGSDLTIDCSLPFTGRGTIIVDGNVIIKNGDCAGTGLTMGIIALGSGGITVASSTNNLNAALFAPNGNIIINGTSAAATFNGFFVAKSIQINRSNISINYDSKIANPALPGFSEVLSPTWMQKLP